MTKIMIFLMSFLSLAAHAGYQCDLALSHVDSLSKNVAHKVIKMTSSEMQAKFQDLHIEKGGKAAYQKLMLNTFMSGWPGEEEVSFRVVRRTRGRDVEIKEVSEKVSLKGNDRDTVWFDSYRLDVDCEIR